MIEQQVQLRRALGPPKLRAIEHRRAQLQHRRVERQQLVLETEPVRRRVGLAARQHRIEHLLEQRCR